MKVRDSFAGELCAELFAVIPLTVLLGLDMAAYHILRGRPAEAELNGKKYAPFFDTIVEPVPGAAVDRCEGQSTAPAVVKRLRRLPTLAELERLFGPSTIDRANGSGPSNITPDTGVEVHNWEGRFKAEFNIIRGTITGLTTIEFENERVGRSPDAWRKYCDPAPELDLDVIAQGKGLLIDLVDNEKPL